MGQVISADNGLVSSNNHTRIQCWDAKFALPKVRAKAVHVEHRCNLIFFPVLEIILIPTLWP
eukprot:754287-Hanusia_phi.AAC.3